MNECESNSLKYGLESLPTLNNVAMSIVFYINPINSIILYYCKLSVAHQQNGKVSEMIAAIFHFLCSFIEHSAVTAVPCTKASCIKGIDTSTLTHIDG